MMMMMMIGLDYSSVCLQMSSILVQIFITGSDHLFLTREFLPERYLGNPTGVR